MSAVIISKPGLSLEYWPNGTRITVCRAWLHDEGESELLELDERRLASKAERDDLLATLPPTVPDTVRVELGAALAEAAMAVLDAQGRGRQAKEAKGPVLKVAGEAVWDEPVDGTALMAELVAFLAIYVVFPNQASALAVALWIFFTHVHDASDFSPLLIFTSPTRGSGKSRALEVLALLVQRPWKNLSPSDAVLYRKIDADRPTLLQDEADNTSWRDRPGLVALLNGGFSRSGAVVPRCVGEDFEPRDFSVWAPKALATKGLKGLPDTTLSRSLIIRMQRRKRDSEPVTRFRERVARIEAAPLRAKLARWAADHFETLVNAEPAMMPETISDRAADAWTPLVAIADQLGPDWGKRAREAAVRLGGIELEAADVSERLLADIRGILIPVDLETGTALPRVERIHSRDLVEALKALDGAPWADWGRGKGLSTAQLANLLDPFGIGPKQVWIDGRNRNGYELEQFRDAFARNLVSDSRTLGDHQNQRLTPESETLEPDLPRVSGSGSKSSSWRGRRWHSGS